MRAFLIGLALVMAFSGLAGAQEIMIYDGDAETDRGGLILSAWGSGDARESYEVHYIGPRVLRILSQGYYQGAVITLKNPAPVGEFMTDPNAYLELLVKPAVVPKAPSAQRSPAAASRTAARRPATGAASGRPGLPGGGRAPGGGGRPPSQSRGAQRAPSQPRPAQPASSQPSAKARSQPAFLFRSLRMIFLTEKGQMIADGWSLRLSTLLGGGWRRVAIPLAAFKSASPERGTILKGLQIFADRADIFYVGQIRLVVDTSPIRLKATAQPTSANTGATVTFSAEVDAGNSATSISWDFDESNGLQVEAQGPKVEWFYSRPGSYTVTCTASDLYGNKQPATSTLKITVFGAEKL